MWQTDGQLNSIKYMRVNIKLVRKDFLLLMICNYICAESSLEREEVLVVFFVERKPGPFRLGHVASAHRLNTGVIACTRCEEQILIYTGASRNR